MMIGQTKANVERFDKYAKDVQTSEDLPVSGKFEVREAAEMLHMRITSVTTNAEERKSLYVVAFKYTASFLFIN